jgi:hypothetical protein
VESSEDVDAVLGGLHELITPQLTEKQRRPLADAAARGAWAWWRRADGRISGGPARRWTPGCGSRRPNEGRSSNARVRDRRHRRPRPGALPGSTRRSSQGSSSRSTDASWSTAASTSYSRRLAAAAVGDGRVPQRRPRRALVRVRGLRGSDGDPRPCLHWQRRAGRGTSVGLPCAARWACSTARSASTPLPAATSERGCMP